MASATGLARDAVRGGVERTRWALGAVVGSGVDRLLAKGVDVALGTSEELLERYLPGTDKELGECRLCRALGHRVTAQGWASSPAR